MGGETLIRESTQQVNNKTVVWECSIMTGMRHGQHSPKRGDKFTAKQSTDKEIVSGRLTESWYRRQKSVCMYISFIYIIIIQSSSSSLSVTPV